MKRPAIDPAVEAEAQTGTIYPDPFKAVVAGRTKRRLGPLLGLTDFGVNLTELAPGAASALRHWHHKEDEFVYVLEGEVTLVTDAGEQVLKAGQAAGFPKGVADG
ncbi:MAG TPA: cupin domain-containing protein, partial [Candidatus Omnitrophota bacterium]|nr:cupin domain-containing protein [Candidatus Omnitrophota bacterium]